MAELIETGPMRTAPPPHKSTGYPRLVRLLSLVLGIDAALYLGVAIGFGMVSSAAQRITAVTGLVVYFIVTLMSPLAGLLMWLVLYPFAETTLNLSLGGSIPDLSPTRLMAGFLFCLLLAEAAIRKRPLPRLTQLDWWGALFIAGIG